MKKIIIATKNKGKAAEFKAFFNKTGIEAYSLLDVNNQLPEIEETEKTFEGNAALKAEKIADVLGVPVLADDSGLIVDALNGEPGVYSARYAGETTNDQTNIDKVLEKMQAISQEKRTARFICVLALVIPDSETIFCTGYCEGEISSEQAGTNGFGYDPIFIPAGYSITLAQLSSKEKNKISHRSNAIAQLEKWLQNI